MTREIIKKNPGRMEVVADNVQYRVTRQVMAVGSVDVQQKLEALRAINPASRQCFQLQNVVWEELIAAIYG